MYTTTTLMTTETAPVMLKKKLGEGSCGSVYSGMLTSSRKKVAVKVVRKVDSVLGQATPTTARNLQRVRSEAKVMSKLNHRHVCRCYGTWETTEHFYLFLKLARGGDLLDWVGREGAMGEAQARRLFKQLLSAVSHLHAIGLVHRDINPQNILLNRYGNFMLADFGLMSPYSPDQMLCGKVGTFPYTAPEVLLNQPYTGPEVDIFSCGAVLAAMLTGCVPFGAETEKEMEWLLMTGAISLPDTLSPEVRHLITRMVHPDPDMRIALEDVLKHPWIRGERYGPSLASWRETIPKEPPACKEDGFDSEEESCEPGSVITSEPSLTNVI